MMNLRGIIAGAAITLFTSMSYGQVMVHVDEVSENPEELTETICTGMSLTDMQKQQFQALDEKMTSEITNLQSEYRVNSSIYLNKLRMLNERYDVEVRSILTLEQYAIYLNNHRADQFYDSEYESENVCLKRTDDGDVYYEDETGSIKITEDKFVVDNDLTDRKIKITDRKIKLKDKPADKKVKITDDKIVIVEDGNREVIKDDKANYEDDLVEIEIEDSNS